MTLYLSGDPQADALLAADPLALVIGMLLDQQVPLERAFAGPAELARRLAAPLDAGAIAAMDPGDLAALFSAKPALHRYPASMAQRVQALCRQVVEVYQGDPGDIWKGAADGVDLRARLEALPGFGDQKARILVALLGKQLGVRPPGWQEASEPFGRPGTFLSVADIVDPDSLARVRADKQARKAAAKAAGRPTKGTSGAGRVASSGRLGGGSRPAGAGPESRAGGRAGRR